jgi:hypothetical protein
VRATSKTPDAIAADIKSNAEGNKWLYLGDNKIKSGEMRLVKSCIPAVSQALWSAGLQLSAMMPCANVGICQRDGKTEISVLHPRFMQVLFPNAETEKGKLDCAAAVR